MEHTGVQEAERWDKIISSKHKLFDLKLRELWQYRDLVRQFIKRDVITAYKQTILGPLWYLIQPIISTVVYALVFGQLANIGTDGVPYALFYFCGTMLWTYFTGCLLGAAGVFTANQGMFGKVYFPRLTVPVSLAAGQILRTLIQFALLMCFYIYYLTIGAGIHPQWQALLFPLLILWIGALGTGIGLIVSSLTTKYRDLNLVLNFGVQLWMYATPVVYPLSRAPARFMWVFRLNPMSAPIELFRMWFYGAGSLTWDMLAVSLAELLLCVLGGIVLFNRNERTFVDVI